MKKKIIAALLLFALTFTALPVTVTAKKGGTSSDIDETTPQMNISSRDVLPNAAQTITIRTEADFLAFAKDCHLDSYSSDKHAILANDITLTEDFGGIPIFAGTFDGAGHTIEGLSINTEDSYAGLFNEVQATGVVKNVNVKGTVTPEESTVNIGGIAGLNSGLILNCSFDGIVAGTDYVGGIVGVNELTGIISECKTSGMVTGTHFTGGIAGTNHGNIAKCTNESMVNITNEDEDASFESFDRFKIAAAGIKELIGKNKGSDDEAAEDTTTSDIGGIAGISGGVITDCLNNGDVGYDHVGYNIGGIAGRQTGFIDSCTNNGAVRGRKDIGGIAGQAEPYIAVDLSEDTLAQLRDAIDDLSNQISGTLDDSRGQSDVISDRLSVISDITDRSIDDVHYLADGTIDFINDVSNTASDAVNRIDGIVSSLGSDGGFAEQTRNAAADLRSSMNSLNTAVNDVKTARTDMSSYITDETDKTAYTNAKATLEVIEKEHQGYYDAAKPVAYNDFIWKNFGKAGEYSTTKNIDYFISGTAQLFKPNGAGTDNPWSVSLTPTPNVSGPTNGQWYHTSDGTTPEASFPDTTSGNLGDAALNSAAETYSVTQALLYADAKYRAEHNSLYATDVASQTIIITSITEKYLDTMSDQARKDATAAINSAKSAADHLSRASSSLKSTMKSASGSKDFPTLSGEYRNRADSLADNLSDMNDNFSLLNDEMHNASDVMIDDLHVVNNQFKKIMDLFTDAVDELKEDDGEDVFNDTSLEEAEKTTDAVIASCTNYGWVYGDIDSGGIAGTMAVEYDFDKEGKITGTDDGDKVHTSFLTKCVLRDNNNHGIIRGEKDYAGGITGLQEMGAVLRGNNYGDVRSRNGSYVGGIAGSSLSYILKCNSEGVLSGKGYVGGIAGNAVKIIDCFSLVQIKNCDRWFGAIAGHISEDDDTEIKNNFYTSDTLFGINRVSYAGKAAPVAYEDRKDMLPSVPDEFSYLTVTYLLNEEIDEEADTEDEDEDEDNNDDDDTVVLSRSRVPYGHKLNPSDYPDVTPPTGCYVSWDIPSVDEVLTDQTITATYKRYRTSISDGDMGSQHHSDLLVDGLFRDGDKLIVKRSTEVDDPENALKEIGTSIGNRSLDFGTLKDFETLEVTVPNDGAAKHTIRFRPQNRLLALHGASYELYQVSEDGKQTKLTSTGKMGEYDLYEVSGRQFTLSLTLIGGGHVLLRYGAIALGCISAAIVLLILLVKFAKKNGYKIPETRRRLHSRVHERIAGKERLFFDEKTAAQEASEKEKEANGGKKKVSEIVGKDESADGQ